MSQALRSLSRRRARCWSSRWRRRPSTCSPPRTSYFKTALNVKDILTVVNMQYYNSGSMLGCDGKVYSQGSVDFLTALACIQLEGGLDPAQVGLGCPGLHQRRRQRLRLTDRRQQRPRLPDPRHRLRLLQALQDLPGPARRDDLVHQLGREPPATPGRTRSARTSTHSPKPSGGPPRSTAPVVANGGRCGRPGPVHRVRCARTAGWRGPAAPAHPVAVPADAVGSRVRRCARGLDIAIGLNQLNTPTVATADEAHTRMTRASASRHTRLTSPHGGSSEPRTGPDRPRSTYRPAGHQQQAQEGLDRRPRRRRRDGHARPRRVRHRPRRRHRHAVRGAGPRGEHGGSPGARRDRLLAELQQRRDRAEDLRRLQPVRHHRRRLRRRHIDTRRRLASPSTRPASAATPSTNSKPTSPPNTPPAKKSSSPSAARTAPSPSATAHQPRTSRTPSTR